MDTALRAQDPAVLITPGPTVGGARYRDPVVDLLACAIPPHFVQPWATVEVVRDSGSGGESSDDAGDSGEEERLPLEAMGGRGKKGPPPPPPPPTLMLGAGGGDATETALLQRPEAVLELLRGCAVRTGGVVHLLPAPTDAVCRGVRLLCRRAPEFVVPPPLASAPETSATASRRGGGGSGGGVAVGGHRSSKTDSSSGRPRQPGRRHSGGGEKKTGAEREAGLGVRGQSAGGGGGGDWASRLSDWGVVTTGSEVVIPHKALEVWYHDVTATAAAAASATASAATTATREGAEDITIGFVCLFIN